MNKDKLNKLIADGTIKILERDATGAVIKLYIEGYGMFDRRPDRQVLRKQRISSQEMTDRGLHIVQQ